MRRAILVVMGLLTACLPAAAQNIGRWKTFTSQAGGFSVRMPGTPTEEKDSKETNPDSSQTHTFIFSSDDSAYFVTYTDFQADSLKNLDAAAILKAGRDGGIKNVKGRLLSDHEITLDGNPGRDVSASFALAGKEGRARFRLYLVKARLYMVLLVGPAANVVRPETDAFLKSFHLVNSEIPDTWKTFSSTEGQFTIRVPDVPKEATSKLEIGGVIHQFAVDKKDHAYIISYNLIADGAPSGETIPLLLSKGKDAMMKSMGGILVEDHDISLAGNPGKAIKFSIPARKGIALVRSFIVKDRYYQVMVLGERKAMESAGAEKFFTSFQLLGISEPLEWKNFTSKDGGFSVDLPGIPKEEKLDTDTHKFRVDKADSVYLVVYVDLPQSVAAEDKITATLEGARDGEMKVVNGTVTSQKRIELGGSPGLEVKFTFRSAQPSTGGFGIERYYLIGKRLYEIAVLIDQPKPDETAFARIFDSFKPE